MAFSKIILNGTTLIDLTSDTVATDNLIAPNTAHNNAGVGIVGTASGGSAPNLQSKNAAYTPSATTQTESITADSGYDGLDAVNGTVNPIALTQYVLRPDAELIQTYTYDKHLVEDEGIAVKTYTTSATSLKAAANLSPTITVDVNNYHYYVVERFLSIPEYNITTKGKGRQEYLWCVYCYELTRAAANEFATLIDPTKKITTIQNMWASNMLYRFLYWTSSSAIALYASNGYGYYQTPTAPSLSGSTLTIKTPALYCRGHATYFTNTYMNAVTDVRYQYVIDVYRAPNNLNVDGWEQDQILQRMIDSINSSGHDLT